MESGYQRQLIYTVNDLSILYNLDPLLKKEKSFPGGSEGKASACNAGDPGLILGLGRSHGEGNGNPPQYFCLEKLMDGAAWWATVHRTAESGTTGQLHRPFVYVSSYKPQHDKIIWHVQAPKTNQMDFSHERYLVFLQTHLVFNFNLCILGYTYLYGCS